jgi:hypothetical protein
LLNCCATGTTNCSGTCKTTGTYTTNDGTCTGSCNVAYMQQRNQCGVVVHPQYSTYTDVNCTADCGPCANGELGRFTVVGNVRCSITNCKSHWYTDTYVSVHSNSICHCCK